VKSNKTFDILFPCEVCLFGGERGGGGGGG